MANSSALNTPHHEHASNMSINTNREEAFVLSDREEDEILREEDDGVQKDLIQPDYRRQPAGKVKSEHRMRQNKFATQRSILKNSQDNTTTTNEDLELLEAKKQIILRRRRLFSHYRQYQEWRRRQFSYDPCYYRAIPPPVAPSICGGIGGGISGPITGGIGEYSMHTTNPNAFRRRRQYRRQFSCAERSREDSRDSRDSSHLPKCHSMAASDTIRTDSTTLNHTNPTTERHSHFHVFQEEHSTSISERITRSRINSAIFVSSEGRGFDSIEFLRRHGSQSVLCRKAKSAENITDNGRKKSFAENRQWHTDDSNGNDAQHDNGIEMHECSRSVENHPVAILKTNVEKLLAATSVLSHSAAVTTSNKVVGSISIETPPSHIREEQNNAVAIPVPPIPPPLPPPLPHPTLSSAKTVSLNSASHDSADTVEELVSIPYDVATTMSPAINSMPKTSKVLVRQRSSTASPVLSSAHSSPKALKLKCITPKLSNLPMVSVSGPSPSPSDEKPPPGECL
ncbi:uncharacterized protein LOC111687185 isoform X7 [Lucilia cuprina]|uniref:uncharacterized protein LOC111687185 isoform X7 n=1 Tax=Lucilia cuprina TaxID=7375 RepID=UPI001F0583C8|nr:uncharacterized protein LOC111687185 isoform X7 [Lucilia cuprina]